MPPNRPGPCPYKRPYGTRIEAENVLRSMRKQGYRGHIYVCPHCNLIHIGRKGRVQKQDQRKTKRGK